MALVVPVSTESELKDVLTAYAISIKTWGTGNAKHPRDLLTEILEGEATLVVQGAQLLRQTEVVCLDILHPDGRVLREDYQLFYADGRIRRRPELDSTTGEKMKPGETPLEAVKRLINEEFPVLRLQSLESLVEGRARSREEESRSYPGLQTQYILHFFTITLTLGLPAFAVQEPDKLSAYNWALKKE